jgi:hypothetical protein
VGSRRGPSWRGRIKGVEKLRGHRRGWWGCGSSSVMLLYRTLHLLGLSLFNIRVCTHRFGGMHT